MFLFHATGGHTRRDGEPEANDVCHYRLAGDHAIPQSALVACTGGYA